MTFSRRCTCDCRRTPAGSASRILPTAPGFIGTLSVAPEGGERFGLESGLAPVIRADGPEEEPASAGTANDSTHLLYGAIKAAINPAQ